MHCTVRETANICGSADVCVLCRLQTALVSLQALLSAPEPTDPQDAEVARQYMSDNAAWVEKARYWTDMYARAERPTDPKVEQLTAMGFAVDDVKRALAAKSGNVEQAMEMLLEGI